MRQYVRTLFAIALLTLLPAAVMAQFADPVKASTELKETGDGQAELLFHLRISSGWHVYSPRVTGGPIAATFHADRMEGAERVGALTFRGNEISRYDQQFGKELQFFEGSVTFVQKVKFTAPRYDIDCYVEYGACSDEVCMPPGEATLKAQGTSGVERGVSSEERGVSGEERGVSGEERGASSEAREATAAPDTTLNLPPSTLNPDTSTLNPQPSTLWQPVVKELQTLNDAAASPMGGTDGGLLYTFLAGLLGGLLALLTPCVWPIIPMTVSFFLKRNKKRSKAIREALAYGASIVVIYVALGLLVTLIYGPSKLNDLATNAWFNIFFAALLVVFAASFFGAFELTLPSSWSNKIDGKADSLNARRTVLSQYAGIFLMAFTLALVSFSCTGPIIGFLLVAVGTQGSIVAPTVGMLGFAVGLAVPFALFALFPSWLKQAPKSGAWMNVIKVTLGFIELAFALKFLSVADLAYGWHLLDREVFLALWIAIFGLLGLYLLGVYSFPHDDHPRRTNVPQFFGALAALAFTAYMVPGLWGAPLKGISAFTPPLSTQDFKLQEAAVEAKFTDYEQGMAFAREQGKPVVIDFTGYGCVNCRKMEGAVWSDPQVARVLNNDYVLISLYVDDKTPLAAPVVVNENGTERKLRNIGDKWSYLQRSKFGANTQPFYVLIDNEGRPLAGARSYDESIGAYLEWLQAGLQRYNAAE